MRPTLPSWIQSGLKSGTLAFGFMMLSVALASVPRVTDDTALYQNLSEIRAEKARELKQDPELARLASLEAQYREQLPRVAQRPAVRAPLQRIGAKKYVPSGRTASIQH